jgi:3-hydroxyacyl-[acyl-carrier-protein] dehydratase
MPSLRTDRMSTLRKEIRESLRDLKRRNDGSLSAHFALPPDFIGFKGHFPDNPVLPGVCQVQAVLVLLEAWMKKASVVLREIVAAKFFAAVKPGDDLEIVCNEPEGDPPERVRALIRRGETKIAELTLRVRVSTEKEASP